MTKPPKRPVPIAAGRRAAGALPADTSADSDVDLTDSEQLQGLLEQFGGGDGYSVRIDRTRDPGMRSELAGYLGALPLTPDLYDEVFESWGGGRYRGRIFKGNAYQASHTFQVAGEPRPRDSDRVPAVESATDVLLRELLAEIKASRTQQPVASPVSQFAEMAKVFREIMPAPTAAAAADPLKMFEMFDTMLDLRRKVAEEGGERPADNGIATIVREGIQPMIELVRDKMEMDKNRELRQRTPAVPGAPAATRHAGASSPPSDPIAQMAARIPALGRGFLAGAARARKDPALYAEMVLDQIPAADYDALPPLLAEAGFVPRLLELVPEWKPYPVWFGEMARAMYRSLTGEIVVEADTPPGGVHAAADVEELHADTSAAPADDVHAVEPELKARTA